MDFNKEYIIFKNGIEITNYKTNYTCISQRGAWGLGPIQLA
jgi:hypothetical protein